jgi:oligopeptidase B
MIDLFKAVIMNVPFLDVLTALCDKDLPLTSTDHEELGNPIEDQ